MFPAIQSYCAHAVSGFSQIPADRRRLLEKLSHYISGRLKKHEPVNLVYICTHNSRRSHFGQVWAKVASAYFGINGINTFSGGTEATAFNGNAIHALEQAGFHVTQLDSGDNPQYKVSFDDQQSPVICFSKVYDHPANPRTSFGAILTCSDAEENCPVIPGADIRIAATYGDPKRSDGKPGQEKTYAERCLQIARESLYVFSKVVSP